MMAPSTAGLHEVPVFALGLGDADEVAAEVDARDPLAGEQAAGQRRGRLGPFGVAQVERALGQDVLPRQGT